MHNPNLRLRAAMVALDDAASALLAVAWLDDATPPVIRRASADAAVTTYEAADGIVDALLNAIIADGGGTGLLAAVEDACRRASDRVSAVYRQAASQSGAAHDRAADRALAVANDAQCRAWARDLRVRADIVIPWIYRQTGGSHG